MTNAKLGILNPELASAATEDTLLLMVFVTKELSKILLILAALFGIQSLLFAYNALKDSISTEIDVLQ